MKIGLLCKENDLKSKNCLNDFKSKCNFEFVDLNTAKVVDYIICFGGDGTTLRGVKFATSLGASVISVNTGNFGFLSAYQSNEIDQLIIDLQSNTIPFIEKKLLEFNINDCNYYALNDVIIERNHSICSETNCYNIKIDGKQVQNAVCDGVIVSTPTGSTAYSLSAGGPILHPSVNAFIATFICSHFTNSHPIVFSDEHIIEIEIDNATSPAVVFADGALITTLNNKEHLLIKKSKLTVKIACKQDYYSTLNAKLKSWSNRG